MSKLKVKLSQVFRDQTFLWPRVQQLSTGNKISWPSTTNGSHVVSHRSYETDAGSWEPERQVRGREPASTVTYAVVQAMWSTADVTISECTF